METQKQTILVLAAESVVLKLLTRILETDGFSVLATTKADEALRLCETVVVDLLITEIETAGKSGPQVAEEVRARVGKHHKVIYLSGVTSKDHSKAQEEVEGERAWFLRKPFRTKELLELVRKALKENLPLNGD